MLTFILYRMLQIVSKTADVGPAYSALFKSGVRQPVEEFPGKTAPRRRGSTVTALNLFYNLPVRQKAVATAVELDALRHGVCALALIHPGSCFLTSRFSLGLGLVSNQHQSFVDDLNIGHCGHDNYRFRLRFRLDWK